MPCPGPFHVSYSVDYIYDFCPLPDPDVGLSIFVCDVEHTSFHFGLRGRKFVLCLFGQCPGLCTICHSWQHTGVIHLSLQADGKVAFEDIPVVGVCCPACHDSSLYLFVLVLFLEAVVLSQVHVALDIFYQHIVHVYWGVFYNHHLCLCDVHLNTLSAKDGDLRLSASNACLPKTEISVFVTECVFFTSTCFKLHMFTLHDVLYS